MKITQLLISMLIGKMEIIQSKIKALADIELEL
jgi:hypothetical protein